MHYIFDLRVSKQTFTSCIHIMHYSLSVLPLVTDYLALCIKFADLR